MLNIGRPILLPFATLIFLAVSSNAADLNINFDIVNANVSPDGFSRAGVLVNGVFPGTLIEANKDDTLHIAVNNQLINPTMRYGMHFFRVSRADEGPQILGVVPWSIGTAWYEWDLLHFDQFSHIVPVSIQDCFWRWTWVTRNLFLITQLTSGSAAFVTQCPISPAHSYTYDSTCSSLFAWESSHDTSCSSSERSSRNILVG